MYGQFHFSQNYRTQKSTKAERNIFLTPKKSKLNAATFISLLLICLSFSTMSIAGSKQPKLAGGNGNVQGR